MTTSKEDLILSEIVSMRADIQVIRDTQMGHIKDISKLKVKAGLWSAVVSAVVAFAAVVVKSWS